MGGVGGENEDESVNHQKMRVSPKNKKDQHGSQVPRP